MKDFHLPNVESCQQGVSTLRHLDSRARISVDAISYLDNFCPRGHTRAARPYLVYHNECNLKGIIKCSRPIFFTDLYRLLEDLEEVQTDKVSMEYLLREKLERLVQSEIEARVARMHQVCTLLQIGEKGITDTAAAECDALAVL